MNLLMSGRIDVLCMNCKSCDMTSWKLLAFFANLIGDRYHHLNHYAMFGGGYKGGAMSLMRRLLGKYGKEA